MSEPCSTELTSGWSRSACGLLVSPSLRPEISAVVGPAAPLLVLARASAQSGAAAIEAVLVDYTEALTRLAAVGCDARPVCPSKDEVRALLRATTDVKVSTSADGKRFRNTFVELDLRDRGVFVLLSFGTGRTLDATLQQPFVLRVADVVEKVRPAGVWAADQARFGRTGWGLAPLMHTLDRLEAGGRRPFLGAYPKGWRENNQFAQAELLADGLAALEAAAAMGAQLGSPKRDHTGARMEGGRVAFGLSGGLPPGFARVRVRGDGGPARCIMALDSPRWLPERRDVHSGLPETVDEHAARVDQVENVRFFLRTFGLDGWQDLWLAEELSRRRFATDRLRVRSREQGGGLDTWFGRDGGHVGESNYKAILSNRELYRTGTYVGSTGVAGEEPVVVEGCVPPDGPWASPEDFARIEAHLASRTERRDLARPTTFHGLPCTVNGLDARLVPIRASSVVTAIHGECAYGFSYEGSGAVSAPSGKGIWVRHAELQTTLVEAAILADGQPLQSYLGVSSADPRVAAATGRWAAARDRVTGLEAAQARRWQKMDGMEKEDPLLGRREDEYREKDTELGQAKVAVDQCQDASNAAEALVRAAVTGTRLDDLAELAASLADPHDTTYRQAWRGSVTDLAFTVTETQRRGAITRRVGWSGALVVAGGGGLLQVPVTGTALRGAETLLPARALSVLADLRAGTVLRHVGSEQTPAAKQHLWSLLGLAAGTGLALASCDDPMLLRLGMAASVPPADGETAVPSVADVLADPRYAQMYGRPEVLARRSAALWTGRRTGRWFAVPGGQETALLVAAATSGTATAGDVGPRVLAHAHTALRRRSELARDWVFAGRAVHATATVVPCAWCGGTVRARMRIHEPDGLVCLAAACRRDRSGVTWPAAWYDRYVACAPLWAAAGVALDAPDRHVGADEFTSPPPPLAGRAPRTGRATRSLAALGPSERADLAAGYARGDKVSDLLRQARVHASDLYAALDEAGLPRRNLGRSTDPAGERAAVGAPPREGLGDNDGLAARRLRPAAALGDGERRAAALAYAQGLSARTVGRDFRLHRAGLEEVLREHGVDVRRTGRPRRDTGPAAARLTA